MGKTKKKTSYVMHFKGWALNNNSNNNKTTKNQQGYINKKMRMEGKKLWKKGCLLFFVCLGSKNFPHYKTINMARAAIMDVWWA